jgi:TRAP-type C4-dicarboxylate transport system permease small subunit
MRRPLFDRHFGEGVLAMSCGALSALALFILMGLTLVDVIGRKWFNNSLTGALELTEILMVLVIFGSLPLVSWRDEHVVFNTFDALLPEAVRQWQLRLVHLLCAGAFAVLAWLLYTRAERFFEYGQTTAQLMIPVGYVAVIMALLTLVTAFVHLVLAFLKREAATASTHNAKAEDIGP